MYLLEVLSEKPDLKEILWNFSHFRPNDKRRLTLRQNPHFYRDLPTSPEAYNSTFQADPIEDFHNVTQVWVLTDKPGRVYLQDDLDTPRSDRVFGNVWVLNPGHTIIFKGLPRLAFLLLCSHAFLDTCGKLEGESHIEAVINDTATIWYRREQPVPRLIDSLFKHTTTTWRDITLWKLAIHLTIKFQDIDMLISTRFQPPKGGWLCPDTSVNASSSSSPRRPFPRPCRGV
jgi:hypothetical protein